MVFLQVEATDALTPIVTLAAAFIASITTLTVAMLRFGLGGRNNPTSSLTKDDLAGCSKDVGDLLLPELEAIHRELIENGKVLAEIKGGLHNPRPKRK